MLVVEKLFLLLTRDNGWANAGISHQDIALSAGLFSDLVLAGFIEIEESNKAQNSTIKALKMPPSADADPELIVSGYQSLIENPGITLEKLLRAPWFAQKNEIAYSLANQGVVTIDSNKFLGISWEKFPTVDKRPEESLRRRLAEILKGRTEATTQEALTLIILGEVGNIKVEFYKELDGITSRDVNARVRELGRNHFAPSNEYAIKAVRQIVNSMVSAISGSSFFIS